MWCRLQRGREQECDTDYREGENRSVIQTTERERTGVWCRLQRGREQGCDTDHRAGENRGVIQTTERERTGVLYRLQTGREQGRDTDYKEGEDTSGVIQNTIYNLQKEEGLCAIKANYSQVQIIYDSHPTSLVM